MSLLNYFHPKIVFETGTDTPSVKIFHSRNSSLVSPSVVNSIQKVEEEKSVLFSHRNRAVYSLVSPKNTLETEQKSKLPEIKSPNSRKQASIKEEVIASVYKSMGVFNGLIKEKGKFHADLVRYLLDHGHAKSILFYQQRWSSKKLALDEAIAVLRPHFDSILPEVESHLTLSQQKMRSEYKRYSTVVSIGESGDHGWEHSDIYEIKGEDGVESYYCINQNPTRLPKLKIKSTDISCASFDEYLQMKNKPISPGVLRNNN